VILLSAANAAALAERLGVGFLRKPFPVELLVATIQRKITRAEGPDVIAR
jgi:hypothetical protein